MDATAPTTTRPMSETSDAADQNSVSKLKVYQMLIYPQSTPAATVATVEFYPQFFPAAKVAYYPQAVFYPRFFAAATAAFYRPSFPPVTAAYYYPRFALVAMAALSHPFFGVVTVAFVLYPLYSPAATAAFYPLSFPAAAVAFCHRFSPVLKATLTSLLGRDFPATAADPSRHHHPRLQNSRRYCCCSSPDSAWRYRRGNSPRSGHPRRNS